MSAPESLEPYRLLIESALVYNGNTHRFEDVVAEVEAENAQFWPAPTSCIVTQIDTQPARKILVFWLAAGNSVELKAMEPHVIEWGQEEGCTLARMAGRKGWARSFLTDAGWQDTQYIIMEKHL